MRTKIVTLLASDAPIPNTTFSGWVKTRRDSKTLSFLEINDGSCLKNIQIVANDSLINYEQIRKISIGSAVRVTGCLVSSPGTNQRWELQAETIDILSLAPDSFPLQKKRHTDEYLRTIAHLRARTNKYGAVFRIRSQLSGAIHRFFLDRHFTHVHTPILTGSDCEGAGALFRVTTLDLNHIARSDAGIDFSDDFFGKEANLTVSGQLSAEALAMGLGDVYTFGPTFRAENSNTRRHAAEFWMVEPEMAFCDLYGNMDLAEELLKTLTVYAMTQCSDDIQLFSRFVDKNLMPRLENIASSEYTRLPYAEAIEILSSAGQSFEFPVAYGLDLQSEHERFLTEVHFKTPVILFDYPKAIKPFYMRMNEDKKTVRAMDVLVPSIGELIGGSQREERLEVLEHRLDEAGLSKKDYWWYIDTRRYGAVEHSGFGLGFERLVMMLTGITNIRDVIPFPRTPKNIDF